MDALDDVPRFDPVTRPEHYTSGDIECIDAIREVLGRDAFLGYLRGQVLKYCWRADKKGNVVQDLRKAKWYLDLEIAVRTQEP